MKKVVLNLALLVLILSQLALSRSFDTETVFSTNKSQYLPMEPVIFNYRLYNYSKYGPRLNNLMVTQFLVLDNVTLNKDYSSNICITADWSKTEPMRKGDSLAVIDLNLLKDFGEDEWYKDFYMMYLPPGIYKVNIKGPIQKFEKDTLSFTVVEPEGDDKEAFELLKMGYTAKKNNNYQKFINCLDSLTNTFPNSVYSEIASYSNVFTLLQDKTNTDTELIKDSVLDFINTYPDSYYIEDILNWTHNAFERQNKKDQGKAFLASIRK